MKKIKVILENSEAIQDALDAAQGKARVRTANASDVLNAAAEIMEELGISKKALNGVSAWIDPNAQSFPNCYKGVPESTQFNLQFNQRGEAFLVNVVRARVESTRIVIQHTEDSISALVKRFSNWG